LRLSHLKNLPAHPFNTAAPAWMAAMIRRQDAEARGRGAHTC